MNQLSILSTEQLPAGERMAQWAQCISLYAGQTSAVVMQNEESSVEPYNPRGFRGRLEFGDLGDLHICRMMASPHRYRRKFRAADAHVGSSWTLVLQEGGVSHFEQGGNTLMLVPSQFALIDVNQSLEVTSSKGCEQIVIPLEGQRFSLGDVGRLYHLQTEEGLPRMLRSMLHDALAQYSSLSYRASRSVGDALLGVLESAIEQSCSGEEEEKTKPSLIAMIQGCIEENLHDPSLNAEIIARNLNWSSRSLHRHFQNCFGCTFSDYVWQRRLSRCAEQMLDVSQFNRSITEIAFSVGFSSSSHFSRSFKEAFGMTPRAYRKSLIR